ncbi:VWA domain-containing protein [Nitrincola schmidtii]|uniref:VWA domain-containing protein n=1 Tax=Nitrincola schmidtii TaxID=1730894 RepID=UPI00124D8C79|nr:VWA domain-containing protein [Nitrincola schmidtii]
MASKDLQKQSDSQAIDLFIKQVNSLPQVQTAGGRLMFALDATASRQASWDQACQLQSELFLATKELGGLSVQLCYYRGFGEFHATAWINDTQELLRQMNGVSCLGGHTQIRKVLNQALRETRQRPVRAVIIVVDCCEEDVDQLCQKAGELGMLKTPVFIFHEGHDSEAERVFKQICKLSGGAYTPFDSHSPEVLRDLLAAVAVYASGGRKALEHFSSSQGQHIKRLTQQLSK